MRRTERAEPDGLCDRGRARHQDAELLRLLAWAAIVLLPVLAILPFVSIAQP
jgi:hypothetical protein